MFQIWPLVHQGIVQRKRGAASWIESLRTSVSWIAAFCEASNTQWIVRGISVGLFLGPLALYLLSELKGLPHTPPSLDVGIIVVAAALGCLVLNAGLNLRGPKRTETIRAAQKFIVVVILMLVFLPSIHAVEAAGGINLNSFEPRVTKAWGRGIFFWIASVSFYTAVILFITALVDLVFAINNMHKPKYASWGDDQTSRDNHERDAEANSHPTN